MAAIECVLMSVWGDIEKREKSRIGISNRASLDLVPRSHHAPYAVLCVTIDSNDSEFNGWQSHVLNAVHEDDLAKTRLFAKSEIDLILIIEEISHSVTQVICRLIRSRLLIELPQLRPYISAVFVEDPSSKFTDVLNSLKTTTDENIADESTRIEVRKLSLLGISPTKIDLYSA